MSSALALSATNGFEVSTGIMFSQSNITASIFPAETAAISAPISTTPVPFTTAQTGLVSAGAPFVATGIVMTTSTLVDALGHTIVSGMRKQDLSVSPAMLSRIPTILLSLYVVNSVLASYRTASRFQPPTMPLLPGLTPKQQQRAGKLVGVSVNGRLNMAQILAPRKFHLRKMRLLKKLGENFDPFSMSIDEPAEFSKVMVSDEKDPDIANDWIRSIHPLALMNSLKALNITRYNSQGLTDITSNQHTPSRREVDSTVRMVMSVLQDWLVKKATCPVRYIWEDMGNLFWPRYIRKGYCALDNVPDQVKSRVRSSLSNNPIIEQDCSWPPGMFCSPREEKRLKIFSWKCKPIRSVRRKSRSNVPDLSSDHELESNEQGQLLRGTKTPAVGGTKGSFQRTLESVGSVRKFVAQQGNQTTEQSPNKNETDPQNADDSSASDGQNLTSILSQVKPIRQKRSYVIPEEIVGFIGTHALPQKDSAHSDSITELEPKQDYSHLTWRELKKKFKVKCKWHKITFPVVQHCQCSC